MNGLIIKLCEENKKEIKKEIDSLKNKINDLLDYYNECQSNNDSQGELMYKAIIKEQEKDLEVLLYIYNSTLATTYYMYNDYDDNKEVKEYTREELRKLLEQEVIENINESSYDLETNKILNDILYNVKKDNYSSKEIIQELASYGYYESEEK